MTKKYCIKCGATTKKLINHHEKYIEIDGYDKIILMCVSCHKRLHMRRRREGKCNISAEELGKISNAANNRRPESKRYRKEYQKEHQQKYQKKYQYKYRKQNISTIEFDKQMMPYIRLREETKYNYNSGNVSVYSRFEGMHGKKLFYIDIDNQ